MLEGNSIPYMSMCIEERFNNLINKKIMVGVMMKIAESKTRAISYQGKSN